MIFNCPLIEINLRKIWIRPTQNYAGCKPITLKIFRVKGKDSSLVHKTVHVDLNLNIIDIFIVVIIIIQV